MIIKRCAKPQASQTGVASDAPISGKGGHKEDAMTYNPSSPDLEFFGGSNFVPQTDEAVAVDPTGVETNATLETGEGAVVESGLSTMIASPEKLQGASVDVGIAEPTIASSDISMEGLSDKETFHNAADAPFSDPIQDSLGYGDRPFDNTLSE
ncbi:uncharacterized protein LOC109823434 [Asparagus officinalis]|uniref:uncharacterized protein LOC109823434 n=1 Tax=Asparagus officinalis TaxID=4686 RepID=UPI00098DFDCF|nr:uncharacterized protein LOC109823434 [Asparagus officinalis]